MTNFNDNWINFHSRAPIWNCRLQSGGHFVSVLMCLCQPDPHNHHNHHNHTHNLNATRFLNKRESLSWCWYRTFIYSIGTNLTSKQRYLMYASTYSFLEHKHIKKDTKYTNILTARGNKRDVYDHACQFINKMRSGLSTQTYRHTHTYMYTYIHIHIHILLYLYIHI